MISEADPTRQKRQTYKVKLTITLKDVPKSFDDTKRGAVRLLTGLVTEAISLDAQCKGELTITGAPWERYEKTVETEGWMEEGGQP